MKLQDLPAVIDINITESLARFSNFEPMYVKYLKRFVDEPTYAALQESIAAHDLKGIETNAHTLKGVAGNLGLTALFNDFNDIVQAVRKGDEAKAYELCAVVAPKMQATRAALSQLD